MLNEIVPFHPLDFFELKLKASHFDGKFLKSHLLPQLQPKSIAAVSLGWNLSGLHVRVDSKFPFSDSTFPDFSKGDAIELMVDCRDSKQGRTLSRYCHHFVCFAVPIEMEGKRCFGAEITRFRGEERRSLCSPEKIEVQTQDQKQIAIFLPKEILHGYEPTQFSRLGFSYTLHTSTGLTQTISTSYEDFTIDQQPCFWPSFEFIS